MGCGFEPRGAHQLRSATGSRRELRSLLGALPFRSGDGLASIASSGMGLVDWLRRWFTPPSLRSGPTSPPVGAYVPHPPPARRVNTPVTAPPTVVVDRKVTRLSAKGRMGIAGEFYRRKAIARVVRGRRVGRVGDWEAGLPVSAYLIREPSNVHDPNAVMVHVGHAGGSVHVGYLRAEVAPAWQRILKSLESEGQIASCPARIYRDRDAFQVVLWLAGPQEALMANPEPEGAVLLEPIRQCAVLGEQHYQGVLQSYPASNGRVWVTLHRGTVRSGKYKGDLTIEPRIDGQPVGYLSAAQGKRYMRLLDRGALVACESDVYMGNKFREVRLWLPRVD